VFKGIEWYFGRDGGLVHLSYPREEQGLGSIIQISSSKAPNGEQTTNFPVNGGFI